MTLQLNIRCLIFLGLFGQFIKTYGQTDSTEKYRLGGFLIMPIEFPIIDAKDLNDQLKSNGYPAADYRSANAGIGLQLFSGRSIINFSFNKSTKKGDQKTYVTEVEYRSTTLNVGYSLTKSQWYSIYPFVGFKGCGLNYLYREKTDSVTTFGNYFQTNLKYKEVTNSRAHLDLGIGLSSQWFYLINFRFGYLLPLEAIRWNINSNKTTLSNSPSVTYNYYFTLTIGLGNIVDLKGSQKTKKTK